MTTDMFYLYTRSVLSSFMTYHRFCIYHYTTSGTSGAGTAYPSGAPEFTHDFLWGSCFSISSFMCNAFVNRCLCFLIFLITIVLTVLSFTDSDYTCCIFKLFLCDMYWHIRILFFVHMLLLVWINLIYCWKCCPLSLICHCKLNFYE